MSPARTRYGRADRKRKAARLKAGNTRGVIWSAGWKHQDGVVLPLMAALPTAATTRSQWPPASAEKLAAEQAAWTERARSTRDKQSTAFHCCAIIADWTGTRPLSKLFSSLRPRTRTCSRTGSGSTKHAYRFLKACVVVSSLLTLPLLIARW